MNDLTQTRVDEIVRLHSDIAGYLKMTLDSAIRVGELLTEQKADLKHGEWGAWCEENLPFTGRTARNYMRAYEDRDRIRTEMVSDLTEAYRLLSPPKPEKQSQSIYQKHSNALRKAQDAADALLDIEAEIGQQEIAYESIATLTAKAAKLQAQKPAADDAEGTVEWMDGILEISAEMKTNLKRIGLAGPPSHSVQGLSWGWCASGNEVDNSGEPRTYVWDDATMQHYLAGGGGPGEISEAGQERRRRVWQRHKDYEYAVESGDYGESPFSPTVVLKPLDVYVEGAPFDDWISDERARSKAGYTVFEQLCILWRVFDSAPARIAISDIESRVFRL